MATEQLPGTKRAADHAQRFRDAMEAMRSRTDLTAKGLAAVGTAAVGAVGYAAYTDAFPAEGPFLAFVFLFLGPLLMIVAVLALVVRFNRASESVLTSTDIDHMVTVNDLDEQQRRLIEEKYERMASLNEVESLRAYQARSFRLDRIADRLPAAKADPFRQRADLIQGEVHATQTQVAALIVRSRARNAMTGWTLAWILVFVGGWYSAALSADALGAERSEEIEIAKACADARTAGATDLPGICDGQGPAAEDETTAGETLEDSVVSLTEAWRDCRRAAAKAAEDPSVCLPLERALAASRGESAP
jgi:hypothetical protein